MRATDLLASTLSTAPAQEDIPAHPTSLVGASNVPALNSLERTIELPPTSGIGALLDTTITPLSSLTTGLVSTGKTPFISLSLLFIHAHGI